jgi:hypothetical protein
MSEKQPVPMAKSKMRTRMNRPSVNSQMKSGAPGGMLRFGPIHQFGRCETT